MDESKMLEKLIEQGPGTACMFAIIYFVYQHGPGLVDSLKKTHKVLRCNQRAILKTQRQILSGQDAQGKRQVKHGEAIHHVANSVEAVIDGQPKDHVVEHIKAARESLSEEHGRS